MPTLVEHHAPVAETWPVEDGAAGQRAVQAGHHLERLTGIKHTFIISCLYLHTLLPKLYPVSRLQLPISQFPAFQPTEESLFRDTHLFVRAGHIFGTDASRAYRILYRRWYQVRRLGLGFGAHRPTGK